MLLGIFPVPQITPPRLKCSSVYLRRVSPSTNANVSPYEGRLSVESSLQRSWHLQGAARYWCRRTRDTCSRHGRSVAARSTRSRLVVQHRNVSHGPLAVVLYSGFPWNESVLHVFSPSSTFFLFLFFSFFTGSSRLATCPSLLFVPPSTSFLSATLSSLLSSRLFNQLK